MYQLITTLLPLVFLDVFLHNVAYEMKCRKDFMKVRARKVSSDGVILKLFRIHDTVVDYNLIGVNY